MIFLKKLAVLFVAIFILSLTSCVSSSPEKNLETDIQAEVKVKREEMRGVWLSFYEISDMCKGKTEEEFTENVKAVMVNLSNSKFNTVFYQARCFSDALYKSSVFPTSKYIVDTGGDKIAYDPLEIFIEIASEYNIDVHAWVNPLRISYENNISKLCKSNPAKILYNEDEDLSSLIICEKGLFYNPADEEARKVILSGVRELLENYDIIYLVKL